MHFVYLTPKSSTTRDNARGRVGVCRQRQGVRVTGAEPCGARNSHRQSLVKIMLAWGEGHTHAFAFFDKNAAVVDEG